MGSAEVEATTLDEECRKLDELPDVIKIDVEGYEWEVLHGAERLLDDGKPLLFLEVHLHYLDKRGISPSRIFNFLQGYRYRFYSSVGRELTPSDIPNTLYNVRRIIAV